MGWNVQPEDIAQNHELGGSPSETPPWAGGGQSSLPQGSLSHAHRVQWCRELLLPPRRPAEQPGCSWPAGCVLGLSCTQRRSPLLWRVRYMSIEGAISQLPGILATAASPEKACSSWSADDSAAWALWPLADPWQGRQPEPWLPCLGHCFLAGTSRWIPGSCWPWH